MAVGDGVLGISPIPGGTGAYEDDLLAISGWGASVVLTMTTQQELDRVGAGQMMHHMAAMKIDWYHLPIRDFGAPGPDVLRMWRGASTAAHRALDSGGKVLAHCRGGCGRSGMAILRLMVERGEDSKTALERLRRVRPCAVETRWQYAWASDWAG